MERKEGSLLVFQGLTFWDKLHQEGHKVLSLTCVSTYYRKQFIILQWPQCTKSCLVPSSFMKDKEKKGWRLMKFCQLSCVLCKTPASPHWQLCWWSPSSDLPLSQWPSKGHWTPEGASSPDDEQKSLQHTGTAMAQRAPGPWCLVYISPGDQDCPTQLIYAFPARAKHFLSSKQILLTT